jgi:hypothetical protein
MAGNAFRGRGTFISFRGRELRADNDMHGVSGIEEESPRALGVGESFRGND